MNNKMKKILLLLAFAAAVYFPAAAQEIVKGEIEDVPAQGSYHPTFSSDALPFFRRISS